jgi:hypothetical protein
VGLASLDRLVTPQRIRAYAIILIVAYVIGSVFWVGSMKNQVDPSDKPLGYDFITFYAASDLALQGRPTDAYDLHKIYDVEKAVVPANKSIFLWHYPPTFQLMVEPLALMPYPVALGVFVFGTLALFLLLVREISDHRWGLLLALAFPATFVNVMHGQNGFLNTFLLGFGLLLLERRPWLAGVCIGMLVYKPHFGVLLPLFLMAQGRWKTFAAAAVTGLAFCAAAYFAFGIEPWQAFIANFKVVQKILENGFLPWEKIPSIFVAMAGIGIPQPIAYGIHIAVAVGLAAASIWAWRQPGDQRLKVALAIPAILAVSPYCFDYDLVLLALPIGLLADYGRRHALPTGAKAVLALAFFTPFIFTEFQKLTHVQLMPVGILALWAMVWITLKRERATSSGLVDGVAAPGLSAG